MKQSAFKIVVIVCDLGGGNRKLFKELEVDYKKTFECFTASFQGTTQGFVLYKNTFKKTILLLF